MMRNWQDVFPSVFSFLYSWVKREGKSGIEKRRLCLIWVLVSLLHGGSSSNQLFVLMMLGSSKDCTLAESMANLDSLFDLIAVAESILTHPFQIQKLQ